MSQDHELGAMPDPAAVRAACERLGAYADRFLTTRGDHVPDIRLLIRALSARDEAGEALEALRGVILTKVADCSCEACGILRVIYAMVPAIGDVEAQP